jgi:hypothetical protein
MDIFDDVILNFISNKMFLSKTRINKQIFINKKLRTNKRNLNKFINK